MVDGPWQVMKSTRSTGSRPEGYFGRIIGTAMAVEPGTRLGHYRIERLLGSGGFGSVYRAHDSRLDRWVAIKALSEGIARGDPDRSAASNRKPARAASLNHPHICSVYEVEHDSGVDYIVMELVDGRPLAQLTSPGGLPIHTVVRYATQIAAAMEHAHARGIVHGDVKAGNVMVTAAGDTKLVDFGLARRVRPLNQLTITQTDDARSRSESRDAHLHGTGSHSRRETGQAQRHLGSRHPASRDGCRVATLSRPDDAGNDLVDSSRRTERSIVRRAIGAVRP